MKKILIKFLLLSRELYPFILVLINAELFVDKSIVGVSEDYFSLVLRNAIPLFVVEMSLFYLKDDQKKHKNLIKDTFDLKKLTLSAVGGFITGASQFLLAIIIIYYYFDIDINAPVLIVVPILIILLFAKYFINRLAS